MYLARAYAYQYIIGTRKSDSGRRKKKRSPVMSYTVLLIVTIFLGVFGDKPHSKVNCTVIFDPIIVSLLAVLEWKPTLEHEIISKFTDYVTHETKILFSEADYRLQIALSLFSTLEGPIRVTYLPHSTVWCSTSATLFLESLGENFG